MRFDRDTAIATYDGSVKSFNDDGAVSDAGLRIALDESRKAANITREVDAAFDCVICGFAVWMFAEPARVLQEFRRVLRPGGKVALSSWAADNPAQTWCHEVLRPFVAASASNLAPKDVRFRQTVAV